MDWIQHRWTGQINQFNHEMVGISMRDTERNILNIFKTLFDEYTLSNQRALLEIERNHHGYLSINFLHYHDSYKTNNKLVQIHEINPDSHERIKNLIIEVLRGHRKIKKGAWGKIWK